MELARDEEEALDGKHGDALAPLGTLALNSLTNSAVQLRPR